MVRSAAKANLQGFAITDHDTIDGIPEALDAGKFYHVHVVPGIEITAYHEANELHLLGYFIEPNKNANFQEKLVMFAAKRRERMLAMLEKLKKMDINITIEDVEAEAGKSLLARPHLADAMRRKGCVATVREAFQRYLRNNGPAFVAKFDLPPEEAIALIKSAGGVAGLAHPFDLPNIDFIHLLKDMGLAALEVYHPRHSSVDSEQYLRLANKLDLIPTGGSDSHGDRTPDTPVGAVTVPFDTLDKLLARR